MCNSCVSQHPDFCPECQLEIGIGGGFKNSKREVGIMSIFGVFAGLGYLGYLYMEDPNMHFTDYNYWYVLLAFAVGVSLVGTFYVLNSSTFYQDARQIPFLGYKLTLLIPVVTLASTIPVFYYLYHLISLGRQKITGKKEDV